MCKSSKPKPPPPLPEAPRLPEQAKDQYVDKSKRRRLAASGTVLTGARGDTTGASTSAKTLLGA